MSKADRPDQPNAADRFNDALNQIDRAVMGRGIDHVSYIWEVRT